MSRYIDADKLSEELDKFKNDVPLVAMAFARGQINAAPTADVEEVVRCKDCKFYKDWGDNITCYHWTMDWDVSTEPNAFCSYGERKTD